MVERDRQTVMVTGTFDVSNFGDLLFPLIAAERLRAAHFEVAPVSPSARPVAYADAVRPIAIDDIIQNERPPAGLLVGGGYVIIDRLPGVPTVYGEIANGDRAYMGLWYGAAVAAALHDIPLALNAPGVPYPFSRPRRDRFLGPALRSADYVCFRDSASAALAEVAGVEADVVPDTALDLPRIWGRPVLEEAYAAVIARHGLDPAARLLAIHVRRRAYADPEALARAVNGLTQAHDLIPAILPLGLDLGDLTVAHDLASRLRGRHLLLDDASSLREIASVIAGSAAYVGGSLHGYITAAAFSVPGVMVAIPPHGKFHGLAQLLDRPRDVARDWPAAFARCAAQLQIGDRVDLPPEVGERLDRHWHRIVETLRNPEAGRPRRLAFLRSHLKIGVRELGAGWLLSPQVRRKR